MIYAKMQGYVLVDESANYYDHDHIYFGDKYDGSYSTKVTCAA